MRAPMRMQVHEIRLALFLAAGIPFLAVLAACSSPKPAQPQLSEQGPRRYSLAGRVVSVNAASRQIVVEHGDIPGFMSAMTMGYSVKDPNLLAPLSADDQIKADVVVNGDDVYLENIVVEKKAGQAKTPAIGSPQPAKSSKPQPK